jgi:hypothetical protein
VVADAHRLLASLLDMKNSGMSLQDIANVMLIGTPGRVQQLIDKACSAWSPTARSPAPQPKWKSMPRPT